MYFKIMVFNSVAWKFKYVKLLRNSISIMPGIMPNIYTSQKSLDLSFYHNAWP